MIGPVRCSRNYRRNIQQIFGNFEQTQLDDLLCSKMAELSTNWKQLQEELKNEKVKAGKDTVNKSSNKSAMWKRKKMARLAKKESKRQRLDVGKGISSDSSALDATSTQQEKDEVTNVLGIDCEYVGVGIDGRDNMLARVSIVNSHGHCIYDKYVKPRENVTDYRTVVSGIRPSNLGINRFKIVAFDQENGSKRGKGSESFQKVQLEVHKLLSGRIVVGHSLKNDFKVLNLSHTRKMTRDTAKYFPFRKILRISQTPSLKLLARRLLGIDIQNGEHDSVVDARVAMRLYSLNRKQWETHIRRFGNR
uniref:RNA exonuclease 4 n=1 Tax=Setaria digitata TaxID=48799 RepID=A0A915PL58_9BILA